MTQMIAGCALVPAFEKMRTVVDQVSEAFYCFLIISHPNALAYLDPLASSFTVVCADPYRPKLTTNCSPDHFCRCDEQFDMESVFLSHIICHIWASESQDGGLCANGGYEYDSFWRVKHPSGLVQRRVRGVQPCRISNEPVMCGWKAQK